MRLKLPKTGKGRAWTLRVVRREPVIDGDVCWGYCDEDNREIVISEHARKFGVARNTLIHEALHRECPFLDEEAVGYLADTLDSLLDLAESANIIEV